MGLLSRAESWLADRTETVGGVTVTYKRANVSATLTATPADQQAAAVKMGQTQAAVSSWMEREYLIGVEAFELAGFAGTPAVGDRITETINGEAVTFELMKETGTGRQPWSYSGVGRTMYRVKCKRA